MTERLTTLSLFVLYQTVVALGIALLPVAVLARQAGVTLPMHRIIERCETAYDARAR